MTAYFRMCGGGGSKELHGASVLVTIATSEEVTGQTVDLYKDTTKIKSGTLTVDKSFLFTDILETGTYKCVFSTFDSGDFEISADDVIDKVTKNVTITTNVTLTLTLEGACEDNIKIYDDTNTQVASCVFASGQTTGTVELTIPAEGGTYKFESTVAKDTTSGTANYTKNVNLTDSSSEVKVMSDSALYWYGNECTDLTGGWSFYKVNYDTSAYITKNKNSVTLNTYGNPSSTQRTDLSTSLTSMITQKGTIAKIQVTDFEGADHNAYCRLFDSSKTPISSVIPTSAGIYSLNQISSFYVVICTVNAKLTFNRVWLE